MKRAASLRRDLLILAVVAALSLAALAAQRMLARPGAYARVTADGAEVARLSLTAAATQTIRTGNGFNVVEVADGAIRVREANCPDLRCVRQGPIRRQGEVIACAPHGLLIVLEGGEDGVDAVSQ